MPDILTPADPAKLERQLAEAKAAMLPYHALTISAADMHKLLAAAGRGMENGFLGCPYPRNPAPDVVQDCNWPVCGYDPQANKVINTLEEIGAMKPEWFGAPLPEQQKNAKE